MPLNDALLGELRAGLPRLEGARLTAELPLYRTVLDQVLPLVPGLPAGFALSLGAGQQLQVRYGSFYANAVLHPEVQLRPTPVITLELASQLVAWGLQRAPLPPFVRLSGRVLQVCLAEIPALADLAPLWPHVERLTCCSTAGGLQVDVLVRVGSPQQLRPAPPRAPRSRGESSMTEGRLQAWLQHQLAAGLPALAGARVTATVPVQVRLVNELIAEGLAEAAAPAAIATPSASATDMRPLLRHIRSVRVDAAPGVITLDVTLAIDD